MATCNPFIGRFELLGFDIDDDDDDDSSCPLYDFLEFDSSGNKTEDDPELLRDDKIDLFEQPALGPTLYSPSTVTVQKMLIAVSPNPY